MTKLKILMSAVKYYGNCSQIIQTFEEMAELSKELSKNLRGENNVNQIAEEIADVQIMLDQMKILFNCESAVDLWESFKLERLRVNLMKEGVLSGGFLPD